MKHFLACLSLIALPWPAAADPGRPYVNDKQVPEDRRDLETIQRAVAGALDQARAATVCVDLGEGSGSGVIVSEDGLVLTAAHVTGGVDKELTVIMEDGTKHQAVSLGVVAANDAAMLRITEPGKYPFVKLEFANRLRLGDWVFALGHSGGFDKQRGSVLRLGRVVKTEETTYQSDCMLIGGDSGGPLFDLEGRLVGIHSRVSPRLLENMHVPVRVYLNHWDRLVKGEFIGEGPFVEKPEKGKGFLGLASEKNPGGGIRVTKVGIDSPAAKAGLREGDILLKLNGTDLDSRERLQSILKEMAAGDRLEFTATRDGKPLTFKLKLGER